MAPSPAPRGQCCVFLFSTSLVDSGTTLIRVGEGGRGIPETYFLDKFSLQTMNVSLPVCSVGTELSQLILSPIVARSEALVTRMYLVTLEQNPDYSARPPVFN